MEPSGPPLRLASEMTDLCASRSSATPGCPDRHGLLERLRPPHRFRAGCGSVSRRGDGHAREMRSARAELSGTHPQAAPQPSPSTRQSVSPLRCPRWNRGFPSRIGCRQSNGPSPRPLRASDGPAARDARGSAPHARPSNARPGPRGSRWQTAARTWSTGVRWTLGPSVALGLEGTRAETFNDDDHALMLRGAIIW